MRRTAKLLVALFALLLIGAGAAFAVDRSKSHQISIGVTIAGIDVGGLSAEQARTRVEAGLRERMGRNVRVEASGKSFVITPKAAGVEIDVDGAVSQAIARSRSGWLGSRVWREVSGARVDAAITPGASVNRLAIERFAKRVASRVDRKPVEAHLLYGPSSIEPVKGSPGLVISTGALSGAIADAMSRSSGADTVVVKAPVRTVQPKSTTEALAAQYPTVITVSREGRRLYLFKDLKLVRTFTVAVGMAGLETPSGLYAVQDKQTNPVWHVPKSKWAGKLGGTTVPPGPSNPIKARWMGVASSVGIHGTADDSSLGSAASHGCIRMNVADVIWLYDRVPVGTPVYIS